MNPWIVVSWVGACAAVVVIFAGTCGVVAWIGYKANQWSGSKSKEER